MARVIDAEVLAAAWSTLGYLAWGLGWPISLPAARSEDRHDSPHVDTLPTQPDEPPPTAARERVASAPRAAGTM